MAIIYTLGRGEPENALVEIVLITYNSHRISRTYGATPMQPKPALLTEFAAKYVWWKSAVDAIAMPERVVAQVMNIGSYEDVQRLANDVGDDYLRQVLHGAEIGQFNERSWSYWHYRLGLPSSASVPPMPKRRLG